MRHSYQIIAAAAVVVLMFFWMPNAYAQVPEFTDEPFDATGLCVDEGYERYETPIECEERCDNCVLDEDQCWSCQSQPEPETTPGLWKRFTNWVGSFFSRVVQFITGNAPTEEPDPNRSELNIAWRTASAAGKSVLGYHRGEGRGNEEAINQQIKDALANADSIPDLLKLRTIFMIYCQDKHNQNYKSQAACMNDFMDEFRKRGDVLKERLLAQIDSSDGSAKTYKRIVGLRSILMAGTNASGEGYWFSTDNIKKVMEALKGKMKEWLQAALVHNASLENIHTWYYFAQAYTKAVVKEGDSPGSGLMEGSNPSLLVRYRARRLALQEMIKIDICNPDPEKLKKFQELLSQPPGCRKILGSTVACADIMSGKLEAAYAYLYDMDEGDEANDMPQNKASEPIKCDKQSTTTTADTSDDEPLAVPTPPTEESGDDVGAYERETQATDSDGNPTQGDPPPVGADTEEGTEHTGADSGAASGNPEPDSTEPPGDTESDSTPASGDSTDSTDEPTEPNETDDPTVEPNGTGTPDPCELPENLDSPECITAGEPNPEEPTATPVVPPDPEEPYSMCDVVIISDPIVGWDFYTQDCNAAREDVIFAFTSCGWQPPLVVADDSGPEIMCYETAGGFIDYQSIIPCHPIPWPDEPVVQCVEEHLMM